MSLSCGSSSLIQRKAVFYLGNKSCSSFYSWSAWFWLNKDPWWSPFLYRTQCRPCWWSRRLDWEGRQVILLVSSYSKWIQTLNVNSQDRGTKLHALKKRKERRRRKKKRAQLLLLENKQKSRVIAIQLWMGGCVHRCGLGGGTVLIQRCHIWSKPTVDNQTVKIWRWEIATSRESWQGHAGKPSLACLLFQKLSRSPCGQI